MEEIRKQLIQKFIEEKEKIFPPNIPDKVIKKVKPEHFEILTENGEIISFIKFIKYNNKNDKIEVEFSYNKRTKPIRGVLFLLEKMREKLSEYTILTGSIWEHNKESLSFHKKIANFKEKGYVWTIVDESIEDNLDLEPFVIPINEKKEEYLIYNGMYLSMYFDVGDYDMSFIKEMMNKYKVSTFVVYHPYPDIRFKYYIYNTYNIYQDTVDNLDKYINMCKKILKKS